MVWQIPDAVDTVVFAPDDVWKYHPKHVEQFPDINKLCNVASCWIYSYIGILLRTRPILLFSRIRVKRNGGDAFLCFRSVKCTQLNWGLEFHVCWSGSDDQSSGLTWHLQETEWCTQPASTFRSDRPRYRLVQPSSVDKLMRFLIQMADYTINTRWFKYDRDWFFLNP
jgi:hypothetical protein